MGFALVEIADRRSLCSFCAVELECTDKVGLFGWQPAVVYSLADVSLGVTVGLFIRIRNQSSYNISKNSRLR
jgi:hypothetical protein